MTHNSMHAGMISAGHHGWWVMGTVVIVLLLILVFALWYRRKR